MGRSLFPTSLAGYRRLPVKSVLATSLTRRLLRPVSPGSSTRTTFSRPASLPPLLRFTRREPLGCSACLPPPFNYLAAAFTLCLGTAEGSRCCPTPAAREAAHIPRIPRNASIPPLHEAAGRRCVRGGGRRANASGCAWSGDRGLRCGAPLPASATPVLRSLPGDRARFSHLSSAAGGGGGGNATRVGGGGALQFSCQWSKNCARLRAFCGCVPTGA